jgi:SAM-dependent methyltransferase
LLAPTTKGGWPLIPLKQHLFAAKIWWEFLVKSQKFGGFTLYQSFPPLSLPGLRDTEMRLATYRFNDFVPDHASILDIGSNMGFISSLLATRGYELHGVEFNPRLHLIATDMSAHLELKNVQFENASFPDWNHDGQFDVVLALAVHKWVGMPIEAFVAKISTHLVDGGVVFFESNNYSRIASDFDAETEVFVTAGYEKLHSAVFIDDCKRKIVVLRKPS